MLFPLCGSRESSSPEGDEARRQIPVARFDYLRQYRQMESEALEAVRAVLESGQLILGPQVSSFEQEMAAYLQVTGYAVAVHNGTDAITLALRALGIGPGDEVLTVANTAVATINAIVAAGATPVLCEICPDTLMLDPSEIERRRTERTRAIVPVHLFGNAVDMSTVSELARQHGLAIVEDCAQACGTHFCGQALGTWGDIGCFSFYPTKNLGAYGDGGLCVTRNRRLADRIRHLRHHGYAANGEVVCDGFNSRLDELQAALLRVKLRHLPEFLAGRRAVAAAYCQGLSPQIIVPPATVGAEHTYHLFVVRVANRARVTEQFDASGIGWGIHYDRPVYEHAAFQRLSPLTGPLVETERAAGEVLSLPCFPELTGAEIERVCEVLNRAIELS